MISSDEDMERLLVRYFMNEEWATRGSQSFESIFSQIGRPNAWRAAYFDNLTTPLEKGALSAILERMAKDGLLRVTRSGVSSEPHYEAAHEIQDHPRFNYLYPKPLREFDFDLYHKPADIQSAIASTNWTGLATKMSPQNFALVKSKSNALLSAIMQSDADFESRLNACKRVEAVIVALEAPNVPWNEVIGLLNHPSVTAFLAALNLIQFLIALAK